LASLLWENLDYLNANSSSRRATSKFSTAIRITMISASTVADRIRAGTFPHISLEYRYEVCVRRTQAQGFLL
ncbi:hypothetical protein OFO94_33125, partial [Escherichia coli]|nr:hypothetical protein [Escherichia coli]